MTLSPVLHLCRLLPSAGLLLLVAGCQTSGNLATEPDFSGVWEMADYSLVRRAELNNPSFTPEAQEWQEKYTQNYDGVIDDPNKFCVRKGMPWTMTSRARGYPTEIYQTEDQIFMIFEGSDNHRKIHLDGRTKPEYYGPSSEGFSVGWWEGETLVIETTGMIATEYPNPYMRGYDAKVTERWTLEEHPEYGQVINIDVTVEDPEIYLEPAKGQQVWKRAPEGTVAGGYNCTDSLWDTYIRERKEELGAPDSPSA